MKHAILVMGFGKNASILQQTINILDDNNIDYYIHWDKRYPVPSLKSKYSNIYYLKDRIAVKWGSESQIMAELNLLKEVKKESIYDYVHLISSNDLPLMTKDYFVNFFTKEVYIGFVEPIDNNIIERIKYFYPNVDFRNKFWLARIIKLCSRLFKVNRLKKANLNLKKGSNWFSIKYKYVDKILKSNVKPFLNGFCADELIIQTILGRFENNTYLARYIDWARGTPYSFNKNDIPELKKVLNTKYAFVRKIKDPQIAIKLFEIKK